MVLVSLAFFLAGVIVAALANNFTVVLVGRSIMGIGGGVCISLFLFFLFTLWIEDRKTDSGQSQGIIALTEIIEGKIKLVHKEAP